MEGTLGHGTMIFLVFIGSVFLSVTLLTPELLLSNIDDSAAHLRVGKGDVALSQIIPTYVEHAIVDTIKPRLRGVTTKSVRAPSGKESTRSILRNSFRYGSSHIDWCEQNYLIVDFIAEFYNTVSNIPFLILPPVVIYLYAPYSLYVDAGVNWVWVLLMVVGAGSGYFHATLTLSGQLFDEWAILWVMMAALSLWTPTEWTRNTIFQNRLHFKVFMLAVAVLFTYLACLYPAINAFLLFAFGVPTFGIVKNGYEFDKNASAGRVKQMTIASVAWISVAVFFWINDRLFCKLWTEFFVLHGYSYPQLHALWHVCVLCGAYTGTVLGSYFKARNQFAHLNPKIAFWPFDTVDIGIPYVKVEHPDGAMTMSRHGRVD